MTNSFLDGVEPDGYELNGFFTKYITDSPLYSRYKVEAMLEAQRAEYEARIEANRKQVLLELAAKHGAGTGILRMICPNELRRMALEPTGVDKGDGE